MKPRTGAYWKSHYIRVQSLLFVMAMVGARADAEPLGVATVIDEGPARLEMSFQSDLWTRPNENKANPLRIYQLSLKSPLVRSSDWQVGFQLHTEGLRIGNAGLSVGEDKVNIGGDLRTQAAGIAIEKSHGNQSSTSFFTSYVSESDEPFKDQRDVALDIIVYHRFEPNGEWQWIAGVDQTKNRGFLNGEVIPVIGGIYRPDPGFMAYLGFPFIRLAWTGDALNKAFTLTPVRLQGELSHHINDTLAVFVRSGISHRSYMHTLRKDDQKRIVFEEKYIEVAALRKVSEKAVFESVFGSSFHRRLYESTRVFKPLGESVNIKSDMYFNLKIGYRF